MSNLDSNDHRYHRLVKDEFKYQNKISKILKQLKSYLKLHPSEDRLFTLTEYIGNDKYIIDLINKIDEFRQTLANIVAARILNEREHDMLVRKYKSDHGLY